MKDPPLRDFAQSDSAGDNAVDQREKAKEMPSFEVPGDLIDKVRSLNGTSKAVEIIGYGNGDPESLVALTNGHLTDHHTERNDESLGIESTNTLSEEDSEEIKCSTRSPCDSMDFALLCSRSASERISEATEPKSDEREVYNGLDDVEIMFAGVQNDYAFGMRSSTNQIPVLAEEDEGRNDNPDEILAACAHLVDLLDSCAGANGIVPPEAGKLTTEVLNNSSFLSPAKNNREEKSQISGDNSAPEAQSDAETVIITCKEFERWLEQTEQSSLSQHYEVPSGPSITEKDLPQENVSLYNPLNIFEPRRTARHSDVPVDTANNVADNALSIVRNNTPENEFPALSKQSSHPTVSDEPVNSTVQSSDSGDSLASIDRLTLNATGLVSLRGEKRKQAHSSESEGEPFLESTSKADSKSDPDSENGRSSQPEHSSVAGVGKKFPKRKVTSRQEADTIQQLKAMRIECDCKEEYSLGTKGTIDRFTLDITNSWRDRKALLPWTPAGVKEALGQTVCQARMTCHGRTFSCPRQIPRSMRHRLYRCAANLPLISLCDIHVANLRNHHGCPTCSIFCELGEFRACSATSGHLYHEACGDKDVTGHARCVHCLKASENVLVKIEDPGLMTLCIPAEDLDPVLIFTPRQPLLHRCGPPVNSYHRDFPVGFRISCSYLPAMEAYLMEAVLKEVDMLERVEMDLSELLFCIKDGDLKGVVQFLLYPRNVEALYTTDAYNALTAPVFLAISERQLSILSVLIQAGFPIDAKYGEDQLTPMEYAATAGYSAAVILLRNLDDRAVCSAALELTFKKLISIKRYDAVALLLQHNVLNFDRFDFSDDEIQEHLFQMFSSKNPVTVTHCATCTSIVKVLKKRKMGTRIADRLLKDWGHDFALNVLRQLNFSPSSDALEYVGDNLSYAVERLRLLARGHARPSSAQKSKDAPQSSERVVLEDLSIGRERYPVEVVNDVDDEVPPAFHYITQPVVQYEKEVSVGFLIQQKKCSCGPNGRCNEQVCDCTKRSGVNVHNYTSDGRLDVSNLDNRKIYECSASCNCSTECRNRLTQRPSFGHFQVFGQNDSWGLRSKFSLPAGYFIGNVVGAVMPLVDVPKYLRAQPNEIIVVHCDMEGGGRVKVAVVTREYGNYTRFIGRAEEGNVIAKTVIAEGYIANLNIALFTKETVPAFEPLVLDTGLCDTAKVGPVLHIPNYRLARKV